MNRILLILHICILFSEDFESIGLFRSNANSIESLSMSDATSAWISGVSSITSNPAGLATLTGGISFDFSNSFETSNVGDDYQDTQYPYFAIGWGPKNSNSKNASLIKGTNINTAYALSYQAFSVNNLEGWSPEENYQGLFNFSESAISFAMAVNIDPVKIGIKWINYNQNFGPYGSQSSNDFIKPTEFGMQYSLNKTFNIGLLISKSSKIGNYDYSIGKSVLGTSINLKNSLIALDIEKLSTNNGNLKFGYKKDFKNNLILLTGIKLNPSNIKDASQISFGLSFKTELFKNNNIYFNVAIKQNINDIASPYSRILSFSLSYKR